MFTKRVRIIYAFLFLFAFTFALSFTLASKAQADSGSCCVYEWCYYYNPPRIGAMGHFIKTLGCVFDGTNEECDIGYDCPES